MLRILKLIIKTQLYLLTDYNDPITSLADLDERIVSAHTDYRKLSKRVRYALDLYNEYREL